MRLVIIESPFSGGSPRNFWDWLTFGPWRRQRRHVRYARAAMADCIRRGEFPIASHLIYTQPGILRDEDPIERRVGITAGFLWAEAAQAWALAGGGRESARVVYVDEGRSIGVEGGIEHARGISQRTEFRSIPAWRAR